MAVMNELIRTFSERGDLAHVALFLWASSASALAWFALRELAAAVRRFDDFVRELARFNDHLGGRELMDTLHTVLRSIRGETKSSRREHLSVFREFLDHLDRISRRGGKRAPAPRGKTAWARQARRGKAPVNPLRGGRANALAANAGARPAHSHSEPDCSRRATHVLRARDGEGMNIMLALHRDHRGRTVPPAHEDRCRRHGRRLCQPVRRDRPGARHGDAGRVRADAEAARTAPHPDAVPARPVGAGRCVARTARGFPRPLRARQAHSGGDARARACWR